MTDQKFSVSLPTAVAAYWIASNAGQTEAAAAIFAPNAIVQDEGHDHHGRAAIARWLEATTQKYQPVVEPLRAVEESDRTIVTARVSGNFPGSPVELDYAFTLRDQSIRRLEIL